MRSRSALSPLSLILLLTILSTTIILPLLFIVLPAVFAHLFLVRSRAQALLALRSALLSDRWDATWRSLTPALVT